MPASRARSARCSVASPISTRPGSTRSCPATPFAFCRVATTPSRPVNQPSTTSRITAASLTSRPPNSDLRPHRRRGSPYRRRPGPHRQPLAASTTSVLRDASSGEWRAQLIRLPKGTIAARRNRHPLRPLLRLRALRESFLSFVVKGCLFSLPYFSLVNKMTELDPRRAAVVAEAESWIGTPFHH